MAKFGNDRASICPGDPPNGSACEYATEHVSLAGYLNEDTGKMEPAHDVAVCDLHYRTQYVVKYGGYPEEMPAVTPEGQAKQPR